MKGLYLFLAYYSTVTIYVGRLKYIHPFETILFFCTNNVLLAGV